MFKIKSAVAKPRKTKKYKIFNNKNSYKKNKKHKTYIYIDIYILILLK